MSLAFMLFAPAALLSIIPVGRGEISPQTRWVIPVAVALFAAGWLLVGASIRPRGSAWRGIFAAAVIYVTVGLLWVVGLNTVHGVAPLTLMRDPARIALGATFWPLSVAQVLGLFGFEFGG